jgi:hypothetical protein
MAKLRRRSEMGSVLHRGPAQIDPFEAEQICAAHPPWKFWPPYRVTMGFKPGYGVLWSSAVKRSVLKRKRIGGPAYSVFFGRFMMSLSEIVLSFEPPF